MIGADPLTRARVRSLGRLGSDLVARGQLWMWNATGAFLAKEPATQRQDADRLLRHVRKLLDVLQREIGDAAFLAGPEPSIADFTVFPIFQTARERFHLSFGEDHYRLNAWHARFRRRPTAGY